MRLLRMLVHSSAMAEKRSQQLTFWQAPYWDKTNQRNSAKYDENKNIFAKRNSAKFRGIFPNIFAKIRNKNNTKYRGISFREIFVATLVAIEKPKTTQGETKLQNVNQFQVQKLLGNVAKGVKWETVFSSTF